MNSPPLPGAESIPAPVLTGQENAPPVTAQHLASLVFLSYRFSQGGIGVQQRLLQYIDTNFHPGFMSGELGEEVRILAASMVSQYFLNPKLHPPAPYAFEEDSPDMYVKTADIAIDDLADVFTKSQDEDVRISFSGEPAAVAAGIIVMDTDYLQRETGRAGDAYRTRAPGSRYYRDPHDSHFIKYGVLQESTNTTEFDRMFSNITNEETIRQLDGHTVRQLQGIMTVYAENHPDDANDSRFIRLKDLCAELLDAR